jgi:hypothetical protein
VVNPEPAARLPETRRPPWSLTLGSLGLLAVLGAGLSKAVLFRNLEYYGSDLFSFLEMTWSWLYAGRLLHDNAYGYHAAIHNFYALLALSPLTIALGAYGLIVGLVLVHGAAVLRVAGCRALDLSARLTVLGGALGPLAFFVFDDTKWGFHPELLYPPLALLLAVELLDGWTWRSLAVAAAIVLIKEDGAIVCAVVVLAHTAWRFGTLRQTSVAGSRRALRSGLVSLLILAVVFLAGMALLALLSEHYSATQATSSKRVAAGVRLLARTVSGQGPAARLSRVREALEAYAVMSALILLPLGRRFPRGLLLLLVAVPPLLAVLMVSSAKYLFGMMIWSPRVATLQVAAVAALVFASWTPPGTRAARPAVVVALVLLSWAGQATLLHRLEYPLWSRLGAAASVGRSPESPLPPLEDRFLRCVADRLPRGLPVSVPRRTRPVFHQQSIVLPGREAKAWHPPRLRVVGASDEINARGEAFCRGQPVGAVVVEAECELLSLVASCAPTSGNGRR